MASCYRAAGYFSFFDNTLKAHLAELVDAADLKSVEVTLFAGSSPAVGICLFISTSIFVC